MSYRPRIVDGQLAEALQASGAVVLEGPKACGKTETARRVTASEVLLDVDPAALQAAEIDPSLILQGPRPRLIDEWQFAPDVWNYVRRAVDDAGIPGQFVLTGSANPPDSVTRHTGAGRFSRLRMRPMTLFELGRSSGEVSLSEALSGGALRSGRVTLTVPQVTDLICAGGWPAVQGLPLKAQLLRMRDYIDQIRRVDIQQVDGVRRDSTRVGTVLKSLSRNVSTPVSFTTLANDIAETDGPLDRETVREYLGALEHLMITEDLLPWSVHLRSKAGLRAEPKRYFVDPSLAVASLKATPAQLLRDLNLLGLLFESLVVRDVRVYSERFGGATFYYGDHQGLEVDLVIETLDGSWGAMEIKLGYGQVDAAAKSLKKFHARVDTALRGEPAFLAVVVPEGYAFIRDDGIAVIPISTLGP